MAEVDVVIGGVPPGLYTDELFVTKKLFHDGVLAMLPASHPLVDADEVAAELLLEDPLACMSTAFGDYDASRQQRASSSARPAGRPVLTMREVLQRVALGDAVVRVTTANERFWPYPGVVYRPVPDAPGGEAGVVTRRAVETPRPPLVRAFERIAGDTARGLLDLLPGAVLADDIVSSHDETD